MYSSFPRADQLRIRAVLAAAWGFSAIAGGGGVLFDLHTVSNEIGAPFPLIASIIVGVFSLVAAFGIIRNKYWFEWVAAWFVSGGVFVYTVIFWGLVINGQAGRVQTASLLSALLMFYIYRIVSCSAHARKQRAIHELVESGEMRLPDA
jgi:predicted ABC-type sugar transport system permease subunit